MYCTEGGRGGGAEAYGTVEGGEFLGTKCVGEVERCAVVGGEGGINELPGEVLRPRSCPRMGEPRGEDEGGVFGSA